MQSEHVGSPALEYLPLEQEVHAVSLFPAVPEPFCPASQLEHVTAPALECFPSVQLAHAVLWSPTLPVVATCYISDVDHHYVMSIKFIIFNFLFLTSCMGRRLGALTFHSSFSPSFYNSHFILILVRET